MKEYFYIHKDDPEMFISCINIFRGIWALYFPGVNGDRTGKGQKISGTVIFQFSSMKLETEDLPKACYKIKILHSFPSSFPVCICLQETYGGDS